MPRRSMNGHRVHVILTDPQYKGINKLAKSSGLGVSELMRRAIDDYLAKAKKK